MFNSFLDGTKTSIEMAAVANACGLDVPFDGLSFRLVAWTIWLTCCGPRRTEGSLDREGVVTSSHRWSAMGGRSFAIFAGACSCS